METITVTLDREKETLLVPLVCRAEETQKPDPVISDPDAVRLMEQIGYDYASLTIPKKTHATICIREKNSSTGIPGVSCTGFSSGSLACSLWQGRLTASLSSGLADLRMCTCRNP